MDFLRENLPTDFLSMVGINKSNAGSQKDQTLRKNLEVCTYPDETKFKIEKAVKQVFYVCPSFQTELIIFSEGGYQKVYIQLKGILQVRTNGVVKEVEFCMMLPPDYPRSAPQVRIINRNPKLKVEHFYQALKSKTDPSSYLLNQKLVATKKWHPSNNLVNVILQGSDLLKKRFPFSQHITEESGRGSNWENGLSNSKNVGWENTNNSDWNSSDWSNKIGVDWANNHWANHPSNASKGLRSNLNKGHVEGGVNTNMSNVNSEISNAKKFVRKQKIALDKINNQYIGAVDKNQHLDITKQSLESQETYLRHQSFQMSNFLQLNQSQPNLDLANLVQPKDQRSEQIISLVSSVKARQDCLVFLQAQFNKQVLSLQDFLKQLRKIEQVRFQQKYLLQKCVRVSSG